MTIGFTGCCSIIQHTQKLGSASTLMLHGFDFGVAIALSRVSQPGMLARPGLAEIHFMGCWGRSHTWR